LKRDLDILSDMIYWPLIDTITWGITSEWLAQSQGSSSAAVLSILVALVLWSIIWRSQSEVARNLIDEMWNNNLMNLFSTPLTLWEWIMSVLAQSIFKMCISSGAVILTILLLYTVNIFSLGWWLVPFMVSTILTGWTIGFISAGIVIRYGQKMQTVVWTLPAILFPLSAVYFPVAQLPTILQWASYFIPTTYTFEAMRQLLFSHTVPLLNIGFSLVLNVVYLALAIVWFHYSFERSRQLNLARFN
jgi:ABC-2 type transport system permease protein